MEQALELETELLSAVADPRVAPQEIADILARIPPGGRFAMRDRWLALARDEGLDPWRRLEAYRALTERAVPYPTGLDKFFQENVAPLGIRRESILDMTIAHAVPITRKPDHMIALIPLPFSTSRGQAGLYLSVRRRSNMIEEVAISAYSGASDEAEE
jgi:hypothetical protein